MGRLVLQMGISIDGFVAAADGSHPWGEGREDPAQERWKPDSLSRPGAHLMGCVTYGGATFAQALLRAGTAIHVSRPRHAA